MVELVIKIPEKIMESIERNGYLSIIHDDEIANAVVNGKRLPKGHGKLIDATILRRGFVVSARFNGTWNLGKTRILSHIDDATEIIEADKESKG